MTVKVGILGTGWGTEIQVPVFRQAGLQIAALWARSPQKAHQTAAELGIPFATADYRELLGLGELDLIAVATPPHLHAQIAVSALESGKHVLCEKPTALNATEAAQMLATAKARPDRLALVDHELRFLPTRQKMQSLIRDGYVGTVFHVEGTLLSGSRLDPHRAWSWWSDRELGGGMMGALGSHIVDALTWLLDRPVVGVDSVLRTFVPERPDSQGIHQPVTSDEYGTLQLRFANDVSGLVHLSGIVAGPPVHRLLVAGSSGSLLLEQGQLSGYRVGASEPEALSVASDAPIPPGLRDSEWVQGTAYLAQALRAALESGDHAPLRPAATFADGLHVQRVLDAARESSQTRRWVEID